MNNSEFQERTAQLEQLVERTNAIVDDDARSTALELLQATMDMHGSAMSRVVELLTDAGESGRASLRKLGDDPLICGLMVLYGVHPVPLEERVAKALERLAPQLRKKSASAELIGVAETMVRVKVEAGGHGCGSSPDALKDMLSQAILEVAPEVGEIVLDGLPASTSAFVPLNSLQPAPLEEGKNYEESAA